MWTESESEVVSDLFVGGEEWRLAWQVRNVRDFSMICAEMITSALKNNRGYERESNGDWKMHTLRQEKKQTRFWL